MTAIISVIEACIPFVLPGMASAVLEGAAFGYADYGANWFKTLGKLFKNLFNLNLF